MLNASHAAKLISSLTINVRADVPIVPQIAGDVVPPAGVGVVLRGAQLDDGTVFLPTPVGLVFAPVVEAPGRPVGPGPLALGGLVVGPNVGSDLHSSV